MIKDIKYMLVGIALFGLVSWLNGPDPLIVEKPIDLHLNME